jgi:hypothetical protein
MSNERIRKLLLTLLFLPATGCMVFGSAKDRALRNQPDFKEGYEDGCAAATAQGADLRDRPVGDKALYANNATYRKGWSSGFQTCRRTDLEPNATPGDNPVRLPGPGH